MINLKKFFIYFSIVALISCAEQNKNIPVTGADVSVENNEEDSSKTSINDETKLSITDNKEKTAEEVLIEELLEVGDRVFFDYDETKFKDEGVETLKRQARFLLKNKTLTVRIEGHCDQRGTREYNLALGERRAFSVKSFLVSLGVAESRVSVISYGKERPQASNNNEAARAQNRTAITVINQ